MTVLPAVIAVEVRTFSRGVNWWAALPFAVPDAAGDVSVELELRAGPVRAFNRYSAPIVTH